MGRSTPKCRRQRARRPRGRESESACSVLLRWLVFVGLPARRLGELVGELEADRDPHEHAETGLFSDKRAHRAGALALILLTCDAVDLRVVGRAEPAAFGERFGEHAL